MGPRHFLGRADLLGSDPGTSSAGPSDNAPATSTPDPDGLIVSQLIAGQ